MKDFHVTRNLLEALERGDFVRSQAAEWLVDHVLALCPVCRRERENFTLECRLGPSGRLAVMEPVLSWLSTIAQDFDGRKRRAERGAHRDFTELIRLPTEVRAGRIERSRRRFRRPELVERLLAEAHLRIRSAPWEAHELAQLALEVTWQMEVSPPEGARLDVMAVIALRARALAHSGNALRVQGQLAAAEREIAAARELVHEANVTDLVVIAELDWLEGVLRGALGQTEAAVRLLERSILFAELGGERHRAAVARLSLGALHKEKAQPERAAEAIYPIVDSFDETADPLLCLSARHNLTLCLCQLGRFVEARQIFARSQGLYRRFDDFWTDLRRRWAEARIERGLGHGERALELLTSVRDGFLEQDVRTDAAMASREMAEVWIDAEHFSAALEAARFALEVFADQGVEAELQTTLDLIERIEHQCGLPPTPRPTARPPNAAPTPVGTTHPSDVHVTREMLRAERSGRLSAEGVTRFYLEHLPSLCPICAQQDTPAPQLESVAEVLATPSHRDALLRVSLRLPLVLRRVQKEEARARRRLSQLLALPLEDRRRALDAVPTGPLGFALADLLLGSAQLLLDRHDRHDRDDREALARAELAREMALRVVPSHVGPPPLAVAELQARAHLLEGEALRRSRRLRRAEQCFSAARALTRELGMLDPELQAELDFGEALLRRDQQRLPASTRLFRRAAAGFRGIRAEVAALRAQIEQGATHRQAGETAHGLEVLQEALAGLDPSREPERGLAALAHHHAAQASFELGRDRDAVCHLEKRRELLDALAPQHRDRPSAPVAAACD